MYSTSKFVEFLAGLGLPEMELIFPTALSFVLIAKSWDVAEPDCSWIYTS